MFTFLALLGFLGFIIFPIVAIVSVFKKNGKAKKNIMIAGISLIVFFVGVVNAETIEETTEETDQEQTEEIDKEAEQAEKETKEKAKEEAEQKAKEETEQKAKEAAEQKAREKADKAAKEKAKTAKDKADKKANLNDLKAHFIDVGQADAIFLEYSEGDKNYNILIDSGDWNSNAAVNYLEQMNIKQLDLLVGTHPHSDHIGQMDTIINQLDVSEVWMSGDVTTTQVFERVINAIDDNDVDYNEPRSGEEYEIGPLDIKVLAPTHINGNLNDDSIVFKATYGNISFLFTGDAEKGSEQTMVGSGLDLKADILKLGHHGSDTSSTASFIEAVDPKVGVISVGKKNNYGHPSASVVDRMNSRGVDLYSTNDHGTIIIETDGDKYDITTKEDGNVTPATGGGSKPKDSNPSKEDNTEKTSPPKETPSSDCIDINSANEDEVQGIIHIGPERAPDVIKHRPYNSIDDLGRIKGIGPARIKDIKEQNKACTGG